MLLGGLDLDGVPVERRKAKGDGPGWEWGNTLCVSDSSHPSLCVTALQIRPRRDEGLLRSISQSSSPTPTETTAGSLLENTGKDLPTLKR